jgi:hypothetical protein
MVIEKMYMDESEIVTWKYDYKTGWAVKGSNLLTALYHSEKSGQVIELNPVN